MKWFRVDKSASAQPTSGTYRDWKSQIREEGRRQCVYCSVLEGRFGGERNFHVEHYRPKSQFKSLTNDIRNLFYVCAICNAFKGSDWPAEPAADHMKHSYPDPSLVDYAEILSVDDRHMVRSSVPAGRYVIERIYLNRPQLVMARSADGLLDRISILTDELLKVLPNADPAAVRLAADCIKQAKDLIVQFGRVAPYEPEDVRREHAR